MNGIFNFCYILFVFIRHFYSCVNKIVSESVSVYFLRVFWKALDTGLLILKRLKVYTFIFQVQFMGRWFPRIISRYKCQFETTFIVQF